jgi:LysM repeat protein
MRTIEIRRDGLLVALAIAGAAMVDVATPRLLQAQEAPTEQLQERTHTVRRGDTLWDLAQAYLNDPFQWPEIFRINQDVVEDPHWIYPGEVLRIPGPMIVRRVPDDAEPAVTDLQAPTVFAPRGRAAAAARLLAPVDATGPSVRSGQVIAAPYVLTGDTERGTGRILDSRELRRVAENATSPTEFYSLFEEIHIVPPQGALGTAGERYLVIDQGPVVEPLGRALVPVGIIEVVQARFGSEAAIARVIRQFREMRREHKLVTLDTTEAVVSGRPEPVTTRRRQGSIRWIFNDHELPSIQSYVVTDLSSRDGVRIGDEISLFEPVHRGEDGEPDRPERPVARAQIVRVTDAGSTAIIIGQRQPAIRVGTAVRVIAAMR